LLSDEGGQHRGVFVKTPRGFVKPGKVLESKPERFGFKQSGADQCLILLDTAICSDHSNDTSLLSLKHEYIDEVSRSLQNEGMEVEVEDDIARFLGVSIVSGSNGGIVLL
jgi:hypothetical protein